MAGWWKVFTLTPLAHAQNFFVNGFAESWIPEFALWTLGVTIPFVELIGGVLLLVGLRTKETLFALGILLLVTTYGHALQTPLFDINGHTFTRFAILVFLLMLPADSDTLGLDGWCRKRPRRNRNKRPATPCRSTFCDV